MTCFGAVRLFYVQVGVEIAKFSCGHAVNYERNKKTSPENSGEVELGMIFSGVTCVFAPSGTCAIPEEYDLPAFRHRVPVRLLFLAT